MKRVSLNTPHDMEPLFYQRLLGSLSIIYIKHDNIIFHEISFSFYKHIWQSFWPENDLTKKFRVHLVTLNRSNHFDFRVVRENLHSLKEL